MDPCRFAGLHGSRVTYFDVPLEYVLGEILIRKWGEVDYLVKLLNQEDQVITLNGLLFVLGII